MILLQNFKCGACIGNVYLKRAKEKKQHADEENEI